MRERLCAASRPSAKPPSGIAVEADAEAREIFDRLRGRAGEAIDNGGVAEAVARGHRVEGVQRRARRQRPSAAAIPPCAQSVEPSAPSGHLRRTTTGRGARLERRHSPATPPPTMTGVPR